MNTHKIIRIKCGNGNCYIVSNRDSAILVDTCRLKYRQRILDTCKNYPIKLIILTHGHIDHIQNAAYLSKELNVPVAMCKEDLDLLQSNQNQTMHAHSFLGKVVLMLSIHSFNHEKFDEFSPDIFLKDNDSLHSYGINATVLHLPGHTNGSIALDIEEKDLIVGDAKMNMFYPCESMLYHDKNEMLKE